MAKIFILFINFIVLVKIQENGISCVSLYTNILRNEYVCFDHMVKDSRGKWYNLCNWCHGLSPSEYYLYLLHNNVLIRRRRRCNKDCLWWVIKVICIEISPLSPNGNQFTFQIPNGSNGFILLLQNGKKRWINRLVNSKLWLETLYYNLKT